MGSIWLKVAGEWKTRTDVLRDALNNVSKEIVARSWQPVEEILGLPTLETI